MRSRSEFVRMIAGSGRTLLGSGEANATAGYATWYFYSDGLLEIKSNNNTVRTWNRLTDWNSANTPLVTDLKLEKIDQRYGIRTVFPNTINIFLSHDFTRVDNVGNCKPSGGYAQNIYYDGTLFEWCNKDLGANGGVNGQPFNLYLQENLLQGDIVITQPTFLTSNSSLKDVKNIKSILFDNISSVSNWQFSSFAGYCADLESVYFNNAYPAVNTRQFYGCSNLTKIDFSQVTLIPELIKENAFYGINANAKIIVPDNLYDDWIVATNWNTYASKIVKASEYVE